MPGIAAGDASENRETVTKAHEQLELADGRYLTIFRMQRANLSKQVAHTQGK